MRRETFLTLAGSEIVLFYALVPVVLVMFAVGVWILVRKYRAGHGATRLDAATGRMRRAVIGIATQGDIGRGDPVVAVGHVAVFYGFLALVVATAILFVNDDILKPLTGNRRLARRVLPRLLAACRPVRACTCRRARRLDRPPFATSGAARLPARSRAAPDHRPPHLPLGDWALLGSLLFLGVTGFVIEAYRIAVVGPSYEVASIVGWTLARGLNALGVTSATPEVEAFRHGLWWLHAGVALVAVAAIPYTKAVHMLVAPVTLTLHSPTAGRQLAPVVADAGPEGVGYARLADFSPIHLAQLDACTKCGRCHVACPAFAAGSPLSPRDLVLDLRESAEGGLGARALLRVPPLRDASRSLLGDPIRAETLWACTHCMACVEACPVGIEHVPIINQLRRRLVELGELDEALQGVLEKVASTGNSFGEPRRKRGRWARELPVPIKDARKEPCEYLWFTGDYASFDPRAVLASGALAEVLAECGVDVGLLYDGERSAGCDVRRVGEEGLWQSLAEENIESLSGCDFERILTTDPHTSSRAEAGIPSVRWVLVRHPSLGTAGGAAPGGQAGYPSTTAIRRDLPRPVLPRPLQSGVRTAARCAPGARGTARRDAAQPRQCVLLRRRRGRDLDAGTRSSGPGGATGRAANRRGACAR